MKKIFIIFFTFFFFACASTISTSEANELSLGMTKSEVIEVLGEPERVSAAEGKEILEFALRGRKFNSCVTAQGVFTLGLGIPLCGDLTETFEATFINNKLAGYRTYQ